MFSPNADGRVDDTIVVARLAQAVRLSAEVRSGDAKGPVVRTLFAEQPFGATDVAATWDGRMDEGAVAADGPYFVVFRAADACGGGSEISTRVEVDTVPPEVEIAEPAGEQRVSASVDVLGSATDLHFALWELDLNCGGSPEWTRLATRSYPVAPGSFLARWDTVSRAARRVPAASRGRGPGGEPVSGGLRDGDGGAGRAAGGPVRDARRLLAQRRRPARRRPPSATRSSGRRVSVSR